MEDGESPFKQRQRRIYAEIDRILTEAEETLRTDPDRAFREPPPFDRVFGLLREALQ